MTRYDVWIERLRSEAKGKTRETMDELLEEHCRARVIEKVLVGDGLYAHLRRLPETGLARQGSDQLYWFGVEVRNCTPLLSPWDYSFVRRLRGSPTPEEESMVRELESKLEQIRRILG